MWLYNGGDMKTTRFNDERNPAFKNIGKDPESRLRVVAAMSAAHVALHPEAADYTCEHGAYVGAGGCLAKQFCEYCAAVE
jgi:hypothetical protein